MNFICKQCSEGADIPPTDSPANQIIKKALHDNCKGGTWCDCLHRSAQKQSN